MRSTKTGSSRGARGRADPERALRENTSEKMKRLTIDITDDLHRRVKQQCAADGLKIADVARELLRTWVIDQKRPKA